MVSLFFIFMILFMLLLGGLGVSNFVAGSKKDAGKDQQFFALIYLLMAIGLVVYSIQN